MKRKFILALTGIIISVSAAGCKVEYAEDITSAEETQTADEETVIRVRYSDERFTSYLEYCEAEYERANTDIDVILELVSSENYINEINSDSASGHNVPDVYMAVNSDLGTLYLAGLASKNTSEEFGTDNYCETAVNACSYNGNLVAYPLAYETSFLLYNTDFLKKADTVSFAALQEYSENAVFLSEESASIESVFRCEINDMFTNYGYISDGMVIGGDCGDDSTKLSIVNDTVINAAEEYLALIDYFSISTKNTYEGFIKKFNSGSFLSVIATTSSLASIESSDIAYGISAYPDYNDETGTSPLSITTVLAVNPFSSNTETAADFAEFATAGQADSLYGLAKLPSCRRDVQYENSAIGSIYESYAKSTPKNKLIYGEQVYPLLEIALHNIVAGEDIETELTEVDDYMKAQVD